MTDLRKEGMPATPPAASGVAPPEKSISEQFTELYNDLRRADVHGAVDQLAHLNTTFGRLLQLLAQVHA